MLYLLTYNSDKEGMSYSWFESEEELRDFAEDVEVIDAMLIKAYEDLSI